ncbi:MAG: hypothetical protein AB1758_14290 [Candidatus Eremiobacterota bacterium]
MANSLADLAVLLGDPAPDTLENWLQAASRALSGYTRQPLVVRRTRNARGEQVEVRRRSEEAYLSAGQGLFLSPEGRLFESRLESVRHLRRRADESIDDEVYQLHPVDCPTEEQSEAVRRRCLEGMAPLGYRGWTELSPQQRERLASYGGTPDDAGLALQQLRGAERLAAFQLFMSDKSHTEFRARLLEAGQSGRLPLSADLVPWMLTRPDWNLRPELVSMARQAVEADRDRAWDLRLHPNPLVRLRLVDLLAPFGAELDWVGWLSRETDEAVRDRVRHTLEQHATPSQLVDRLMMERDGSRREALGWALVHWKGDHRQDDILALNRALRSGLGNENKRRLRGKLSRMGELKAGLWR